MASEEDAGRESARRMQAMGWVRVARASAGVYGAAPAAGANAALFDAIEYAATEARLGMGDLVDAYIAGAPHLDMHEAWDHVEDYLGRIAHMHEGTLRRELARIDRALPDWRQRLAMRIAVHDLALAAHRASAARTSASIARAGTSRRLLMEPAPRTPPKTSSTRTSLSFASSSATCQP